MRLALVLLASSTLAHATPPSAIDIDATLARDRDLLTREMTSVCEGNKPSRAYEVWEYEQFVIDAGAGSSATSRPSRRIERSRTCASTSARATS